MGINSGNRFFNGKPKGETDSGTVVAYDGFLLQKDTSNEKTYEIVKVGDFKLLQEEFDEINVGKKGQTINRGVLADNNSAGSVKGFIKHCKLRRTTGELGELTITVRRNGSGDDDDDVETAGGIERVSWSIRGVETQLPITSFWIAGAASGVSPHPNEIEAWRREPKKDLYENYQFEVYDGTIGTLTPSSRKVAEKIKFGIETVMRFYPCVTKRTKYIPGTRLDAIGTFTWIDNNIVMAETKLCEDLAHVVPYGALSTLGCVFDIGGVYNKYAMKIQDDVDIDEDGNISRTEAWQLLLNYDRDLYGGGSGRWEQMGITG